MDTRTKILTAEAAAELPGRLAREGRSLVVVSGYFDPLVAEHARLLEQARGDAGALLVAILSPERPLLDGRARAELVAALAVVDYVVLPGQEPADEFLSRIPCTRLVRQEPEHERITRDLIAHVHRRQQSNEPRP